MANAIFAGSSPIEEKSVIPSRKTSRANSTGYFRRPTHEGTISLSYVSPVVHAPFMNEALAEARASLAEGGIPIGCVLVRNGQVIARGRNRRIQRNSVILHAELDCLETAGKQATTFYKECILYTTLSPNAISSGAIRQYGIPRIVIGDDKTFHGDEAFFRANNIQVDILDSHECQELLSNYIKDNSSIWYENICHEAN